MIRLVPAVIHPNAPASERRVFEAMKASPGTERWIVLHSLGIANSWGAGYGEIDFVVLIPGLGLVCVEVKGGGVKCDEGVWTTRNHRGEVEPLKRSPFAQVQDNMWKLQRIIKTRFGDGASEAQCPMGWMVVLPDVSCPRPTPEFTRADVIDRDDVERDIARRIQSAPSLLNLAKRPDLKAPSNQTTQNLLRFLRPTFERVAMSSTTSVESKIAALTDEQYGVLDGVRENPVCLVKGPAGTGKTMLALEEARRASAEKKTALLACFNRPLGAWLSDAIATVPKTEAGTLHALLRARILRSSFADEFSAAEASPTSDFYSRTFFELGALAIHELAEKVDTILIDEVQDFPSLGLGEVIRAWISHLPSCRVVLFADFTRQALYGGRASQEQLKAALASVAVFNLTTNCRNTKRIAIQTDLMTGFTGTRIRNDQADGDPVEIDYVHDEAQIPQLVGRIFERLREAGFKPSDVTILGARQRPRSSLAGKDRLAGWFIRDFEAGQGDHVAYSTIHAFKGLEQRVVIVIDTHAKEAEEEDALLYVAMSRARIRLFVICDEKSRATLGRRIAEGAARMVETR